MLRAIGVLCLIGLGLSAVPGYRALTPRATDARNLLNPVTLSATSIAYSSIRMEPTFMMLGEAAGTAAALAIESNVNVQAVSYQELRRRLTDGGLRLTP